MTNATNNDDQINIDQELAVADFGGRKLAVLLASLPVDDEVKEGFLVWAESASLDELQDMEEILELLFLRVQAQGAGEEEFKEELIKIKNEMDADEEKINGEFLAKLAEIEALIKV